MDFEQVVNFRIKSLMSKYKGEFIYWDVSNEMFYYDFYEERFGFNVMLGFFEVVYQVDLLVIFFMNEFNVLEICDDVNLIVDFYIVKFRNF